MSPFTSKLGLRGHLSNFSSPVESFYRQPSSAGFPPKSGGQNSESTSFILTGCRAKTSSLNFLGPIFQKQLLPKSWHSDLTLQWLLPSLLHWCLHRFPERQVAHLILLSTQSTSVVALLAGPDTVAHLHILGPELRKPGWKFGRFSTGQKNIEPQWFVCLCVGYDMVCLLGIKHG